MHSLANRQQPLTAAEPWLAGQAVTTAIHSWRQLGEASSISVAPLQGSSGAEGTYASASALQAWQTVQHGSTQEEGEVEAAVDGLELLPPRLMHGDTAEEDLLQGLLLDEAAGDADEQGEVLVATINAEGQIDLDTTRSRSPSVPLLDDSSAQIRRSTATAGSTGGPQPLQARHSVYRLVLRNAAYEAHFQVSVFLCYPLCPPVFAVTKLVDMSRNPPSTLTSAVNEIICLEQQVRYLL